MRYVCMHAQSLSHVGLCNPMGCTCPTPLFMGFPRQEYWSGLSCPPPEDLPDPGIKSMSPAAPALAKSGLGISSINITWIPVQSSSVTQSYPTLCNPMNHSTPGLPTITNSWSSPKPMSIESVMRSNHRILSHPLLLLPLIFPSIRAFPMSQLFTSGGQSI